jgi:hypothetical protein
MAYDVIIIFLRGFCAVEKSLELVVFLTKESCNS